MTSPKLNLDERIEIWRLLSATNEKGCWLWHLHTNKDGYGYVGFSGKVHRVHVLVYEYQNGKIPVGLELDHTCRNRSCWNPCHLEPVTHTENMIRAGKIKTHCKKGHPYDEANTRLYRGRRYCWTCCREAAANHSVARSAKRKVRKEATNGSFNK